MIIIMYLNIPNISYHILYFIGSSVKSLSESWGWEVQLTEIPTAVSKMYLQYLVLRAIKIVL